MLILRIAAWLFLAGVMAAGGGVASCQDFPNKPMRILAAPPGGSGDLAARLIAQGLSGIWAHPAIVDNRGGIVAIETVLKAPPDGYTMVFYSGSLWLAPFLRVSVSYDPVRDFVPITLGVSSPHILVVHPSVAANSVKELIALARARPGELNYASGSTGGSPHLAAELFKAMAGVNIVRIPYKGGAASLNSLVGGEVQLNFASGGSVAPHVKSGRLRALAVTSAQPSALAPGLPTVAASGLPGYESATIIGMLAPAKTPVTIINRLNQGIVQVLNRTEVKERLFNSGVEAIGSSSKEFAATIKSDMARLGKVIKDAGIREE